MKNAFTFVIFGGTGNLTYIKLIPAFYYLIKKDSIYNDFQIIGIGRKDYSTAEYVEILKQKLYEKINNVDELLWSILSSKITYLKMDFKLSKDYLILKTLLGKIHMKLNSSDTIYYLATAPNFFSQISSELKIHNMNILDKGYQRLVIEKPFGYDLKSATEYNSEIGNSFDEKSIFRIDHFLGKEMIQNIFFLRFTNIIFEKVWDNKTIKSIQIIVDENTGIENRGSYYDNSGALKDMVQNHLIQILALVAMEKPENLNVLSIKKEKIKILKNLVVSPKDIIFGQYLGYTDEKDVAPNSTTETFVSMKCFIDNERWKEVPFYLRTGKNLDTKCAEIIIEFQDFDCFNLLGTKDSKNNLLVIKIQPKEGIYFRFNSKEPGVEDSIISNSLDYCQSCNINYRSPEAYEKLIIAIVKGDSTLFTSWDELEVTWKFIDELVKYKSKDKPHLYTKGSNGPFESNQLLSNYNDKWLKE